MTGGRAVGLEVHHQYPFRRDHQPVDAARDRDARGQVGRGPGQGHLGARACAEDRREAGVVQHGEGGGDHLGALRVGQVAFARQHPHGGVGAVGGGDVGQAFQQAVDQVAAPEAAQTGAGAFATGERRGGGDTLLLLHLRRGGEAGGGVAGGRLARPVGGFGAVLGGGRDGGQEVEIDAVAADIAVQRADLVAEAVEGLLDDRPPVAGFWSLLGASAHDDDAVAGAGQGDVEQAQGLVADAGLAGVAGGLGGGAVFLA
ncbi:hypothetical protein D3C80_989010 [compost metagenome]